MRLDQFAHVVIRVAHGEFHGALSVLGVQVIDDASYVRLALLELGPVVVAHDHADESSGLVAFESHNVIEAFIPFCMSGSFPRGEHAYEFGTDEDCILHLVFCGTGVDVDAVHFELHACSVEALVLQAA